MTALLELGTDPRAITIKQPWTWCIATGAKPIENRSQGTSYRGPLLIHAGRDWSERGAMDPRMIDALERVAVHPDDIATVRQHGMDDQHKNHPRGVIVAVADLVDSHPDASCCRPWGESEYEETSGRRRTGVHHLVLAGVVRLSAPVEARGQLGLWRPPPHVLDEVRGQLMIAAIQHFQSNSIGGTR